jgi:hypothetical protein
VLVIAISGMSSVPSAALTTPAMVPLRMQCAHGYSGCIGVLSDRLPSRLAFRDVVAVNITITDGSDWAPEVVMVLSIEHGYERLVEANRRERHKPRAIADTHLFGGCELTYEWMVGWWTDHEPEPGGLGLLRRTLCTGLAAVVLELVIVSCPFLARQRNRRIRPKLG